MKIAVNVQTLVKNHLEGLGWFTYESFKRIVQRHPEHEFLFIFTKGVEDDFIFSNNVKAINVGPPFFRPQAWFIKFQILLPYVLKKNKIDLFISTDGFSSTRLKIRNLNVIHDLNFEENPQWLPRSFAKYYQKYFPKWTKNATRIVTVSEYSKQDIHRRYNIPLNKIDVVYNGSNDLYKPISFEEQEITKTKYTSGKEYFVFVGNIHPRKNIDNLLLGFDTFKTKDKNNTKLVIIGNRSYWNGSIKQAYNSMKYKDDVVFTGRMNPDQIRNLYSAALALTFVPYFEGFGIPIIEAMNCDTAVITSNVTSMPEVAGDAAIYVDPFSVQSIADAMIKIYSDSGLRNQLIEKGKVQRQKFSWDKTANKFWNSIEKVLND